jgi:hypothetical protein
MSFNTRLLESINIVAAAPPADFNSDNNADYVSLKNYDGCLVVVTKAAGTAGDDFVLKLTQATDVSGTSDKALNINHVYAKVGTQTGVGTFTKYSGTAASSVDTVSAFGTDLTADSSEALFVIDVRACDLDVDGGFDCIRYVHEGDDVSNAVYATVHYILYGARYPGPSPLTAIAD